MAKITFIPYIIISLSATWYVAPFQSHNIFSTLALLCKVIPPIYLIIYLNSYLQNEVSLNFTQKPQKEFWQLRRSLTSGVVGGMMCSVIGDAFMFRYTTETYFLLGMGSFALAQLCYIHALGFHFTRLSVAVPLYGIGALISLYIVKEAPLLFKVTIPIYGSLLVTMVWRAIDRFAFNDGRSSNQKICFILGALSFLVSDTSIGMFKFILPHMHHLGEYFILATYYLAQGLIARGVS